MLKIGAITTTCGPRPNRRELLRIGTLGPVGISLANLLAIEAAHSSEPQSKAKSVILLWLWGGPSHLDTFDLKPLAPREYRGPYSPVPTTVPGIEVCELLPELAARAHCYTIIRSMNCSSNDHGIAGTIGLTGSAAGGTSLGGQVLPGQLHPTHGAVVSRVLGFNPTMPRFVTVGGNLHQGKRRISGEGGGSLGAQHDAFRLDYSPSSGVKIPDLELIAGQSPESLFSRRGLKQTLNQVARYHHRSTQVERMDKFSQQAFSLLTSAETRRVFEFDDEREELRQRYGQFRFGQCCLMARRLVEAGVRFVQVNWSSHVEPVEDTGDGGWDMHDRNFQQFQDRHAWMLDQSLSALLDDLQQRGLLSETIVVAVGEFGRTPKINERAGRDHWQQCYSALVAGGGLRVGQVIGESDARAEFPAVRPVTPADLFRTILAQIGIGTTQLTNFGIPLLGSPIDELHGGVV